MDKTNKVKYLNKILQSQEFVNAQIYQKLLQYLVEASLAGKSPKEVTIAYDVFCIDSKQDTSNNTKVRVYIHNIRKKLDSYYIHEGKNDEIQLEIPKGSYKVKFIDKSQPGNFLNRDSLLYTIIAILFISVLLNIYFILSDRSKISIEYPIYKDNLVWSDYFKSNLPILIVFGDYFLYRDTRVPEITRYIRDFRINSHADLEQFLSENKEYQEEIITTEHTFLGKLAPWCLLDLATIFTPFDNEIELKLSSQLQWDDIDKYNILYVGTFKTLGILSEFIKESHIEYQIQPNQLIYHPEDTDTSFSYHANSSFPGRPYETDFGLIAKIPGPKDNVITLFASTRDIGCLAVVNFLSNPEFLDPFIDEHVKKAPQAKYFEAIFEVHGFERNVINTILLHFNKLPVF
jgi:hypothetical protein